MLKKIKTLVLSLVLLITPAVPLAVSVGVAHASDDTTITGGECGGADNLSINDTNGNQCSITGKKDLSSTVTTAINILSVIIGIVAVIMIVIGGFRYITSGGKQESVTTAKNTILYAVIGLVIVALAQIIVRFVLSKTNTAAGTGS